MLGAKLVVISALTATRPGWVTLNKASGSSLPTLWLHYWFPTIHFHVGLAHFLQLSIMSWKTSQKTLKCFFVVVVTVLNQFLPLKLSLLTFSCLLKKVNTAARNLDACTSERLRSNWWKILIAMEHPKLKDIKSSAVIHQVCTEFCSRCVTKCICTSCLCCCSLCVALSVFIRSFTYVLRVVI